MKEDAEDQHLRNISQLGEIFKMRIGFVLSIGESLEGVLE